MGNLEAAQTMLNAVTATLPPSHSVPDDLANKQRDLDQTKLLIAEVWSCSLQLGLLPARCTMLYALFHECMLCTIVSRQFAQDIHHAACNSALYRQGGYAAMSLTVYIAEIICQVIRG